MAELEQFNQYSKGWEERNRFDIDAVCRAQKAGLDIKLIGRPAFKATPSSIKYIWCAIYAINGECQWSSLAQFWDPDQLNVVKKNIPPYAENKDNKHNYYEEIFKIIIYAHPNHGQQSLTKVPQRENRGADDVYLYVYIFIKGPYWLHLEPLWNVLQNKDEIGKQILELETKK